MLAIEAHVFHKVTVDIDTDVMVRIGREVARALEVSVRDLCAAERVLEEIRVFAGQRYRVPYFLVDDSKVWGATAMVLAEFLCLVGCPPTTRGARCSTH